MTTKYNPKNIEKALRKITARGIRPERIACDMNVSIWSVCSWIAGRRNPTTASVRLLEQLYGVKIG